MSKYSFHPDSVKKLFETIAPHYDNLNHILSLGIDIYWRKMAVREIKPIKGKILDIATGTGDVAIEISNQNRFSKKVFGIDFSHSMLKKAKQKILTKGLSSSIFLILADALSLPFEDDTFDASIIAFGLRNIIDKEKSFYEMVRVVRKGGKVIILELSLPERGIIRKIYPFYFKKILPLLGGGISGDKDAYEYLPESVYQFKGPDYYESLMKNFGIRDIKVKKLTSGIAFIATGIKDSL